MSKHYHYLFKFVIAGDAGVGKSTLIQQFTEENHRNTYIPTQRIHFASRIVTANELQVKCQLWDMAQSTENDKQDSFTGLADSLCKKATSILLLFDLTNKHTFDNLQRWVQEIRLKCDQNISIFLVGNKIDKEERTVSREEVQEFSKQNDISYLEVSSFDHKAILCLFESVAKVILDKISNQDEIDDAMFKSKIKRGKMDFQTPTSPNSSIEEREKIWKQEPKIEDSQQMFSVIDKLSESLKKTCFLEEIIKKIKANIKQKGLFYLKQIKQQLESSRIAQSSPLIQDLFDIFSIIEESSTEQHITLSRISLQNEELIKFKQIESQFGEYRQKMKQLQKRIEILTMQKLKLEQYKDSSENREHNLLQVIDKFKKQKKGEVEKNQNLLEQIAKLENKNMQLSRQLNRYKDEQEELNVQKLIQARQNSKIIDQLESLEQTAVNASLLRRLRKKFSIWTSQSQNNIGQLSTII